MKVNYIFQQAAETGLIGFQFAVKPGFLGHVFTWKYYSKSSCILKACLLYWSPKMLISLIFL